MHRRRRLRARSARRSSSRSASFKLTRQAGVQDGAAAPPLRAHRLGGAEGHRALPDRRDHLRALQPDDVEAADDEARPDFTVRASACWSSGAARSGVAAAELLGAAGRARHADRPASRRSPTSRTLRAAGVALELGGPRCRVVRRAPTCRDEPRRAAGAAGSRRGARGRRAGDRRAGAGVALAARPRSSPSPAPRASRRRRRSSGGCSRRPGRRVLVGGNIGVPLSAQVDASTERHACTSSRPAASSSRPPTRSIRGSPRC